MLSFAGYFLDSDGEERWVPWHESEDDAYDRAMQRELDEEPAPLHNQQEEHPQ